MPFMSAEWCVGRVQREFELCTSWWGVRSVDWFTSVGWYPGLYFATPDVGEVEVSGDGRGGQWPIPCFALCLCACTRFKALSAPSCGSKVDVRGRRRIVSGGWDGSNERRGGSSTCRFILPIDAAQESRSLANNGMRELRESGRVARRQTQWTDGASNASGEECARQPARLVSAGSMQQ